MKGLHFRLMTSSRYNLSFLTIIGTVFLVALFSPTLSTRADQRGLQQPRAAVDAVLVVDTSGSMLKTDSQMLRYEGAKLFLNFLGDNDRLGVVSFSDKAQIVSELKEFKKGPSSEIVQQIQNIKTEGAYSDLLEGIRAAARILDASPRNDAERIIILLSDGKMEPNPKIGAPSARTVELSNQILPELKAKEIKVHSLAFSAQADKVLLGEISAATDGLSWYTATPEDIHRSFASLFLAVKRPQVVQMRSRSFVLDEDVDEATFYITRDDGAKLVLVSPKNEEMTFDRIPDWVTWYAGKNFDVITLREPDIGEWQVQGGVSTDGFATVLTNLKLLTDWPVIVRAEEEAIVQARLYDGEKPVALPEMSGVVQYAFQIIPTDRVAAPVEKDFLNDDGRNGDKIARDGIFSKRCSIAEPGEYKLSIVARSPTFERTQQVPFRVRPRLITFEVASPEATESEEVGDEHNTMSSSEELSSHDEHGPNPKAKVIHGDQTSLLRAQVSKEVLSFREVNVSIEAISSDRKRTIIPLKRAPGESVIYETAASSLPNDGLYTLKAVLRAESKKQQEIEAESAVVRFELTSTAPRKEVSRPVVVKENVAEPKKEDKTPLIPIIIITLANIVAGTIGIALTKKKKLPTAQGARYNPPKQVLDAIEGLEERLKSSEIKIGDVALEAPSEEVVTASTTSEATEKDQAVEPPKEEDSDTASREG